MELAQITNSCIIVEYCIYVPWQLILCFRKILDSNCGQWWANPARFKSKSSQTFKSKSTLPKKLKSKSKSTPFKNDQIQIQIRGFKSKSTNPDLKIDALPSGLSAPIFICIIHLINFDLMRPFQVIYLFLVKLVLKNRPGNQGEGKKTAIICFHILYILNG